MENVLLIYWNMIKMNIQLSDHFNYRKLLRFTLPSIIMLVFTSITEKAKHLFSLIVYASIICGIVLAFLGFIFLRPLASVLGTQGQLLEDSVKYGRIILLAIPAYILQYEFQCLFATAEKPSLGLYVTIAAGVIIVFCGLIKLDLMENHLEKPVSMGHQN